MKAVSRKIYPDSSLEIEDPLSPPRWQELGWRVGWIIEEGYTGLQWWVTSEEGFEELTGNLGEDNQQKTQMFVNWYVKRLKQLGRKLGVPVRLESVRWRRIDFRAISDRPRLAEKDWWQVGVSGDLDQSWQVLLPDRFMVLFDEEKEVVKQARLPWKFSKLWEQLSESCRTKLLRKIGTHRGSLNHLAGLIAAGTLKREDVLEYLPANPRSELEELLAGRKEKLVDQNKKVRRQTEKKWKEDAEVFLAKQVGGWLEEGALSGEGWESCSREWEKYRLGLLQKKYSTEKWKKMWQSLSAADIQQLVPRLDFRSLVVSFAGLEAHVRAEISEALPQEKRKQFLRTSEGSHPPENIFGGRQKIYRQGKKILKKSDIEIEGNWEV